MVASGRITGALLECRLFDQGIVAIFPHDKSHLLFLLGFFNSAIASDLVRQVNPTANNSANYIKRIPMVIPTISELAMAESLVQVAIKEVRETGLASKSVQGQVDAFYANLWTQSE